MIMAPRKCDAETLDGAQTNSNGNSIRTPAVSHLILASSTAAATGAFCRVSNAQRRAGTGKGSLQWPQALEAEAQLQSTEFQHSCKYQFSKILMFYVAPKILLAHQNIAYYRVSISYVENTASREMFIKQLQNLALEQYILLYLYLNSRPTECRIVESTNLTMHSVLSHAQQHAPQRAQIVYSKAREPDASMYCPSKYHWLPRSFFFFFCPILGHILDSSGQQTYYFVAEQENNRFYACTIIN